MRFFSGTSGFATAFAAVIIFAGCAAEEAPPVVDDLPPVLGVHSAEDLDSAKGKVEYALTVSESEIVLAEGMEATQMWTFNGISPGPLLVARVGDLVRVHVTNELDEPTTVHWHGMRVPVEMDGVVADGVPAIEPGETFTYEFIAPDAGTYWYHPHIRSKVQVEAGLYGPIVIHEPESLAPEMDTDRIWVLDDIRVDEDGSISEHGTSHPDQMHGRHGNLALINGSSEISVTEMAPGAVERWRLVNSANARTLTLRFPGLEVREIGADGGLWPQKWTRVVEEIVLPVGARAELEVRLAEGAESGGMDLVILTFDENDDVVEMGLEMVSVEVNLKGKDNQSTGHTANPTVNMPDAVHGDAEDHDIEFDAYQGPDGVVWTINGHAWPDYEPWSVGLGEMQIIKISNALGPTHPFHLHGQQFSVLSRNGRAADEPGLRDTVQVDGRGTLVIAVNFDNPGTWMYHCHILEHAALGMMALVEVQ